MFHKKFIFRLTSQTIIMKDKIKLIWDFRGPAAKHTAIHHEIHLKEYAESESLSLQITGVNHINDMHSIAFLAVQKSEMITVRDALKPHRGQIYSEN